MITTGREARQTYQSSETILAVIEESGLIKSTRGAKSSKLLAWSSAVDGRGSFGDGMASRCRREMSRCGGGWRTRSLGGVLVGVRFCRTVAS